MQTFHNFFNSIRESKQIVTESPASDAYEKAVAKNIVTIGKKEDIDISAERPTASTEYSDILCKYNGEVAWIEVKMNHTDNLSNPRFYYENGKWGSTYKTPVAEVCVKMLNKSKEAKEFVKALSKFTNIPEDKIVFTSSKAGLKKENSVSLEQMKEFVEERGTRYIVKNDKYPVGELVRAHYGYGKDGKAKANYLQTGDDFYKLSEDNPLGFADDVPIFDGTGHCYIRVSTRSEFYEIQAEVKVESIEEDSPYSFKPGSSKPAPFAK